MDGEKEPRVAGQRTKEAVVAEGGAPGQTRDSSDAIATARAETAIALDRASS